MRANPKLLLMTVVTGVALSAATNQPPQTMVRMVVRLIGPSIKPNSFAALPKTIYRGGSHFARIEDPPDSRQQIQKLTIIAEPDAYSINLIDRRGTHAVDQGGPGDLHLPIVLPFDPKHELTSLDRLEFGDEYDFFDDAGAKAEPGPVINAKQTDALRLPLTTGEALLVMRGDTHIPVWLSWQTKEGTYKYEYIEYAEQPFKPSLFSKLSGIAYRDIPPDNTGEH